MSGGRVRRSADRLAIVALERGDRLVPHSTRGGATRPVRSQGVPGRSRLSSPELGRLPPRRRFRPRETNLACERRHGRGNKHRRHCRFRGARFSRSERSTGCVRQDAQFVSPHGLQRRRDRAAIRAYAAARRRRSARGWPSQDPVRAASRFEPSTARLQSAGRAGARRNRASAVAIRIAGGGGEDLRRQYAAHFARSRGAKRHHAAGPERGNPLADAGGRQSR